MPSDLSMNEERYTIGEEVFGSSTFAFKFSINVVHGVQEYLGKICSFHYDP